jgi:multimeric flavodoxin WrbA
LFFPERFGDTPRTLTITVFHGSPRKGNTYHAAKIFMDELAKHDNVRFIEFFLPNDLPVFCTGCTLCLGGKREKCPNAQYVAPIFDAVIKADAFIFATPHYGACAMPAGMKTLLDHLDFLVLNIAPRPEIFDKKAFIITTAAGSTAAIKPIKTFLRHWGLNRVYSLGFGLLTDKWSKMPNAKQARYEKKLRRSADKFYSAKIGRPYFSTVFYYHMTKFILKRYVGAGNYPYEYWKENGWFKKRPF